MEKSNEKKRISRRTFLLSGLVAALGGYFGYTNRKTISNWINRPNTGFSGNRPNIIIIGMDTLRADHLGCYGYKRNISPSIDAFAKDSVLYTNTMSQSNWTLPAFASLLTGLYPHNHLTCMGFKKKLGNVHIQLPKNILSLAEILGDIGYDTVAYTGSAYVSKKGGLEKGFKDFYEYNRQKIDINPNDLPWQLDNSIKWLKKNNNKRNFFLFIHSYECHRPLRAPKKCIDIIDPNYNGPEITGDIKEMIKKKGIPSKEEIERNIALYDAEILYSDTLLGDYFNQLKELGIYDDSLIVFMSDHGEEFYDHKYWEHSITLYEEMLHVPVMIKYPQGMIRGVDDGRLARLIDIVPTILFDVLRLPENEWSFDGVPLSMPLSADYSISEGKMNFEGIHMIGFRSRDEKIIIDRIKKKFMVFDLEDDPSELNGSNKKRENLKGFFDLTYKLEKSFLEKAKEFTGSTIIDDNTIKMFKDLGYVE